jgi:hypothetical protein
MAARFTAGFAGPGLVTAASAEPVLATSISAANAATPPARRT